MGKLAGDTLGKLRGGALRKVTGGALEKLTGEALKELKKSTGEPSGKLIGWRVERANRDASEKLLQQEASC